MDHDVCQGVTRGIPLQDRKEKGLQNITASAGMTTITRKNLFPSHDFILYCWPQSRKKKNKSKCPTPSSASSAVPNPPTLHSPGKFLCPSSTDLPTVNHWGFQLDPCFTWKLKATEPNEVGDWCHVIPCDIQSANLCSQIYPYDSYSNPTNQLTKSPTLTKTSHLLVGGSCSSVILVDSAPVFLLPSTSAMAWGKASIARCYLSSGGQQHNTSENDDKYVYILRICKNYDIRESWEIIASNTNSNSTTAVMQQQSSKKTKSYIKLIG